MTYTGCPRKNAKVVFNNYKSHILIASDKTFSSERSLKSAHWLRHCGNFMNLLFSTFVCFHAWTCLKRHFIRLLNLEHCSVRIEPEENVWMAQSMFIFFITCLKYRNTGIKSTEPNSVILVSFFWEEYILSDIIKMSMIV